MLTLTLLGLFLLIIAATWFMGLWSNMLTLINLILAATIACGFFEAIATQLDNSVDPASGVRLAGRLKAHTYFLDFCILWLTFFIAFGILRMFTDSMSKYRMKFNIWVELAGRSVFSIWIAWVFICFTTFTLHVAPIPAAAFGGSFQATPESRNFLGIGPDRLWLAYLQSRSQGALANWEVSEFDLHPDDRGKNMQPFDSKAEFIYKYHHRREQFATQESDLVNRSW